MGFLLRRKRDWISQKGILDKHRNHNKRCVLGFVFSFTYERKLSMFLKTQNPQLSLWVSFCGERGIRTPGPVTDNSFQDCRIRPLCHFSGRTIILSDSGCKYRKGFSFCKSIFAFFNQLFFYLVLLFIILL